MHVIICTDNRNGMMFNHRRQSQDRTLRDRVGRLTAGSRLLMNSYTAGQFGDALPHNAVVAEDFLEQAREGDYCFVEDADARPYADRIEKLIIYRWNRDYPGDSFLPIDLTEWTLEASEDFEGYSHERITEEVYA